MPQMRLGAPRASARLRKRAFSEAPSEDGGLGGLGGGGGLGRAGWPMLRAIFAILSSPLSTPAAPAALT